MPAQNVARRWSTGFGRYGGSPEPGGLNESYSYDPFGNLTSSGSYNFSPSYSGQNQINGYSYDANGDQNTDIYGHSLSFNANGLLTSVNGGAETYVYDASGSRVQVAGSATTDYIYFNGMPIATFSSGTWTDLIYAGGGLLAEVAGNQSALPTYRLTDNLGTLGGSLSSSGSMGNTVNYTPYGELFSGSTSDSFGFTGLPWDSTTALWHADARQFSPQQSRWQSPDLFDGSYNWGDPQSLNRYAYVNGRPTSEIDPSGQDACSVTGIAVEAGAGPYAAIPGALCVAQLLGGGWLFDHLLGDIFGHPKFHGSLKPRPSANPWDDKFGLPYPGLGSAVNGAIGLPTGSSCEFGACGPAISGFSSTAVFLPAQNPCLESPQVCNIGPLVGMLGVLIRAAPAIGASALLLSLEGDNRSKVDEETLMACADRYAAEQARCTQRFGRGGRFGKNRPKGACLDRAFYRYQACVNGDPDPAPPMASVQNSSTRESAFALANLNGMVLDWKPIWAKEQR